MSFSIIDNTAGSQRFSVNNSQQIELGPALSSSELSVNGNAVLSGASLAAKVVPPGTMPRVLGSVTLSGPGVSTTVSLPASCGFCSVSGPGYIVAYNSTKNQITILANSQAPSPVTLSYGSF